MIGSVLRIVLRIITFILLGLTVAAAYAGYIPPMIWALPSVLVLGFPYLLCATFIVGICWLISRRLIMAALCGGAVFLVIPAASSAFTFSFSKTPSSAANTFTLLTYNVLEGRENEDIDTDYSRTFSYMIKSGADIICAQELHAMTTRHPSRVNAAQIDSLRAIYPFIIEGEDVSQTVFSKYPVVTGGKFPGDRGDFSLYHFRIKGRRVDIASVHLTSFQLVGNERKVISGYNATHPEEGMKELKHTVSAKLLEAFRLRAQDAIELRAVIDVSAPDMIVCGDFNDVPASWVYRQIKGSDMKDAVAQTCFGPVFTYNDNHYYFRLDQILYRGDMRAVSVKRGSLKSSDHYPLLATFEFKQNTK